MMDPASTLSAGATALSKASDVGDYLDYWRNYKGERVDIRESSLRPTMKDKQYVEDIHIIRGTIGAIHGQPSGLLLTDVKELHRRRKLDGDRFADDVSKTTVINDELRRIRQVNEKIVAFSEIGELELTEDTNDADRTIEDLDLNQE